MFELTDAIAEGRKSAMLEHLGALFEDGGEAVVLIGMVGWHLRRTLRGASLAAQGASAKDIARAGGVHWRQADRFAATCRRLGTLGAVRAIRSLRIADRLVKSTAEDKRLVLERTLLALIG